MAPHNARITLADEDAPSALPAHAHKQHIMAQQESSTNTDRRSFNIAALAIGAAVLAGFTILPRLAHSPRDLIGKPAPDFSLEVAHNAEAGDRIHLSELKGKPVLLSFWATWCGPCRLEAPSLERVSRKRKADGLTVVGVNMSDDRDRAVAFAKQLGLSYPILHDEDGSVASSYGVKTLPTLVIVDKNGIVSAVRTGLTDEASIDELITAAQ